MSRFKYLSIRCSQENYEQIQKEADEKKMSISDYIRFKLGFKDAIRDKKKVKIALPYDLLREAAIEAEKQGISVDEYISRKLAGIQ